MKIAIASKMMEKEVMKMSDKEFEEMAAHLELFIAKAREKRGK